MNTVEIYTDGTCEPSPGTMGVGFIIIDGSNTLSEYGEIIGTGTNNLAEFDAVYKALSYAEALFLTKRKIELYSDSALVVNILNSKWKTKKPHLKPIVKATKELMSEFKNLKILWIAGENNEVADELSRCGVLKPRRYQTTH